MARIPLAQEMGLAPRQAQQTRGVVNVPVVDTSGEKAAARALGEAGRVVAEIGARITQADTDRKIVEASRKTREDLDREFRNLSESGDIAPEEFETRYREATDKIISENGQIVPAGGRDLWRQRALEWQSDGVIRTRDLQRQRQLEAQRAGIIAEGAALTSSAGDLAVEQSTFRKSVEAHRNLINRQVQTGIIGKDDAAQMNAELDQLLTTDSDLRVSQNVDTLLQAGRLAEADALFKSNYNDISPKTRATLERGLEAAKLDNAVVTTADGLMKDAGGSYAKFVQLASKIDNAALRLKVEERGADLERQRAAAEELRQDGLERQMWKHVVGGGTIGSSSASLRGDIDPDRLSAIRAYESARDDESGRTASEKAAAKLRSTIIRNGLEVLAMQDPQVFMAGPQYWPSYYQTAFTAMTPEDIVGLEEKRQKMMVGGTTADAVDGVHRDLMSAARRVVPPTWWSNEDGVKNPKEFELEARLYDAARVLAAERGGQKITPDDANSAVLRALGQPFSLGAEQAWDPKIWKQASVAAGEFDQVREIVRRDRDTWNDVLGAMQRQLGRQPTVTEVLTEYRRVTE